MIPEFFRILHLADSALPSGGYAFSNGLEGAFQLGILNSQAGLKRYLGNHIKATVAFEIPYLNSCFQLTSQSGTDILETMFNHYDASITSSSIQRGSLTMGRSWIRLMQNLYPEISSMPYIERFVAKQGSTNAKNSPSEVLLPTHLTLMYGLSMKTVGFQEAESKKLYLYMVLRDLISAAIRLGVLGPIAGNKLQLDLYQFINPLLAEAENVSFESASKGSPQIELSQCSHAKLYSRLFQN